MFRDDGGDPSRDATGHGDLVDALRDAGLLGGSVRGGGRTLCIANLDNLGATVEPPSRLAPRARRRALTCEVVDNGRRRPGGLPVRWTAGR